MNIVFYYLQIYISNKNKNKTNITLIVILKK